MSVSTALSSMPTSPPMQPAPLFQNHAVLQRDCPLPIWGTAKPRTRVTATLAGHSASATTASDGRWLLRLPALPAGGPHTLQLLSDDPASPTLTFTDLLIGEVWLCSGQSNMEYVLSQVDTDGTQTLAADLPRIRLLTVSTPAEAAPQSAIDGRWTLCTPEAIAKFSAVAGWFGRTLHTALDVPIGLIANAWGGTRIQAWLSREALMLDPAGRAEIAAYEPVLYGSRPAQTFADFDDWFRQAGPENPVNLGERDLWHQPAFDHAAWPTMPLPARWQDHGHDFSGLFWFRRTLPLPPAWRGRPLSLHLGAIDKHDQTYVNGHLVGSLAWENRNTWCTPRHYEIPANLTNDADHLVIAVRVRSHQYHGGLTGPAPAMHVHPADAPADSLPLAGPWHYAVEQNYGPMTPPAFSNQGPGGNNAPYTLFNSRLYPLIPYALRGFIWYQGESNASEATLYRRLLPLMIADWRRAFGQGPLPFLQVQLANYQAPRDQPSESTWAELRSAQLSVLRTDPHCGLAVAIDLGEAGDIHPKAKKPVGQRLARWALHHTYGQPGPPSGPLLRSVTPAGSRLLLGFTHAEGLRTRDGGSVTHLAIAGPDRKYVWAQSRLVAEQLEVWHPEIPTPASVRYAWAENPEGCNLVNAHDLPASPFDTTLDLPSSTP